MALAGPVTVADNKATVTCPAGGLAPGASKTCTASYTITQADLDNGSVTNSARATVNGTNSNEDHETVTAVQNAVIDLVKQAVTHVITYKFTITNNGNVTLSMVKLTDSLVGYNHVQCGARASLAPNESTMCTADYTVTSTDYAAGHVNNSAEACGDKPGGGQACDQATVNFLLQVTQSLHSQRVAWLDWKWLSGRT